MKRKIAMITSEESFHNNYGAALQGYALFKTLEEAGYAPEIIRYAGGRFYETRKKELVAIFRRPLANFYHKITSPDLKARERKCLERGHKKEIEKRTRLFAEFAAEMKYFNKKRVYWAGLRKKYPIADSYICGSDQIWNPYFKCERNDPGYFLKFAPKNAKKIAYAPSFGCNDLPARAQRDFAELLSTFHAISVRENSGVDIVKKYAGREAKLVLDPTLIRTPEQWREVARLPQNLPEHYILCYRFAESDVTKKQIDEISKITGLPVVSMPLSLPALKDDYRFVFEAGPREFIGLIANADYVCTDSFHATVFSVLMKTPVFVFLRETYGGKDSMNSRVYSLLENLGLTDRLISADTKITESIVYNNVDYDSAHDVIKAKREDSIQFLLDALKS